MTQTPARVPLSVLDTAPIGVDSTPAEVLGATRTLAQHAEGLGFTRFWSAEHHNAPSIAASSPAVVAAALGQATSRIRIGTGGILLPNHSALVAAEQLSTLAALHPGRVDFGIGRANSDIRIATALGSPQGDDFPQQIADLLGYLGTETTGVPYKGLIAAPGFVGKPALWLLGSSTYSATLAARLGLPFGFGHHFRPDNTLAALEAYRNGFQPSAVLDRPYAFVALQVICGKDDEHAAYLAGPVALTYLKMQTAPPERLPTFDQAAAYPGRPRSSRPGSRCWPARPSAARRRSAPGWRTSWRRRAPTRSWPRPSSPTARRRSPR
ncbi:MsnO8 family LLM class oxidoreductase [Catenulispora yoronensis]